MTNPKRAIAVSPSPDCLCLAALCRKEWDSFHIAGRSEIKAVFDRWAEPGNTPQEAIILLNHLEDADGVRALLSKMHKHGMKKLTWFVDGRAPRIPEICRNIPGVECVVGPTLEQSFIDHFSIDPSRKLVWLDCQSNNKDLRDYLEYKTSMSFMALMDPAPLLEAVEYLSRNMDKPFDLSRLSKHDQASVDHYRKADFPYIEGKSAPIQNLKKRIQKMGASDLSVFVVGETGTGKEYVSFYLHEFSKRRNGPLVALNCAGLEESFLRSELFGHRKGSFTGAGEDKKGLVEEAHGGTLFLDEIGEMPLNIQADLLRFLQTRHYRPLGETKEKKADIRIIAATQPDIFQKIRERKFREDLYFRIAEVTLKTPALREITEDIRRIIQRIVYRQAKKGAFKETPEQMLEYFKSHEELFKQYSWPGNTRELIGMIRRRLHLDEDIAEEIREALRNPMLIPGKQPASKADICSADRIPSASDILSVEAITRQYVQGVCSRRKEWELSQDAVAQKLGITVNTLKKYLKDAEQKSA